MPAWITDMGAASVLPVLAALGILAWIAAKAWRPLRILVLFMVQLIGTDELDDKGERLHPGLIARMTSLEADVRIIHHEVTPNSGGSLKDAVGRIEGMQREQAGVLSAHLEEAKRARVRQQETADLVEELRETLAPFTDD